MKYVRNTVIAALILTMIGGISACSKGDENTAMVNPMKEVKSSEDFKSIELSLQLPDSEARLSNLVYYIISGETAQISFYDKITESHGVVRAGKESLGDISGIYYEFDDTKEEQWSAVTALGNHIDIRIQVVIDGVEANGVLASWNYNGINYTLWEDHGKDSTDDVAKLAVEIAKVSCDWV